MTKFNLITVAILSAMPSGYRRAGFALTQGENQVDVTPEQLESLQADKRLTVVAINLDEVKKSRVDVKSLTEPDLLGLIEIIKGLDREDENLWTTSGKPKTEALPDGTTAKQRDAAWQVFTSELDSAKVAK